MTTPTKSDLAAAEAIAQGVVYWIRQNASTITVADRCAAIIAQHMASEREAASVLRDAFWATIMCNRTGSSTTCPICSPRKEVLAAYDATQEQP